MMTRASVWGSCTHLAFASIKTMSSGSRRAPLGRRISALCTRALGGRHASLEYLSRARQLFLASCGPPNMVRTSSVMGRSLTRPLTLIWICLREHVLPTLELPSVCCIATTFVLISFRCVSPVFWLTSICCLATTLGLTSVCYLVTTLRLIFVRCASTTLHPLYTSSPQINTCSKCLPWVLWVGMYGFSPQINIYLLSSCSPRNKIRTLRRCRILLMGLCSPSSRVITHALGTYSHQTNVRLLHPHGHWIFICLPCPHNHRFVPCLPWGGSMPPTSHLILLAFSALDQLAPRWSSLQWG